MKKFLSVVLVVAMFASMLMLPTGTFAATELEENVEAKANYFNGTLMYAPGEEDDPYTIKEGGSTNLIIDGHIDEGEWGSNVIHIDSRFAANNQNAIGKWLKEKTNEAMYTHPSAENTYYYQAPSTSNDGALAYDLYLLWDEDFLYLAARVDDPGRHQTGNTANDGTGFPLMWQGDALQFMVDTEGPNSASKAAGQTYKYFAEHNILHDKSTGEDVITYANRPWAGYVTKKGSNQAKYVPVPNFIVTYNKSEGYADACDAAPRYDPYIDEARPQDGTKWTWSRINNGGDDGYDTCDGYWYDNGVTSYISAYSANAGSIANPDITTDYEVAIPWEMITRGQMDENETVFNETYKPEIGAELGMSVVVFNSNPSTVSDEKFDSWLGWGAGICGSQTAYDFQTAGGSNLVTLTGTNYKEAEGCTHTFAEATCVAPETCTKCGYQRGYETGHKFACSDLVLPTGSANGSAIATCTVCGTVKNMTFAASGENVYHAFRDTDSGVSDKFSSGWKSNWYDCVDDSDTEARDGQMLYYKDENGALRAKTAFDKTTFGYSVADCATNGEGLYYADGTKAVIQPDVDFTIQTGTYFDSESLPSGNYTYKLDIYPTDYSNVGTLNYVNGFYSWFGKKAADYMAGLFVFDGETDHARYFFAIGSTDVCGSQKHDVDAFLASCDAYVEVDYSVVEANKWHEFMFFYDDDAQFAAVYWNGDLMVSAHNPQFKYLTPMSEGGSRYALFRRMEIPFYAKNVEVGTAGLASKYVESTSGASYTATINGTPATYAEGETVKLTASKGGYYNEEGKAYRFGGWTADGVTIESNKAETSFVMPANDVTVSEVYFVIGDISGDAKTNSVDANLMKRIITGTMNQTDSADINFDGKVNAQDANLLKAMILGQYTPSK